MPNPLMNLKLICNVTDVPLNYIKAILWKKPMYFSRMENLNTF
jgi:hypothetical protein